MHDDEDRPPRVPGPREGGREHDGHSAIPAPRSAPALECLPAPAGAVATMTGRTAPGERVSSSALVRTGHGAAALALRGDTVASRLRDWGRDVARLAVRVVHATMQGLRAVVRSLVPSPAAR